LTEYGSKEVIKKMDKKVEVAQLELAKSKVGVILEYLRMNPKDELELDRAFVYERAKELDMILKDLVNNHLV